MKIAGFEGVRAIAAISIFALFSSTFSLGAIEYKKYKKCYAQFYPNAVDDVIKSLEAARANPALAQVDDYHTSLVEQVQGTLPEVVFSMTKDKTGKETIMISLGNLQGPWKKEDYPKYFDMFCKQAHPDKKFCAERLREKYDKWMAWLDSQEPKLVPIAAKIAADPNYKWVKDVMQLRLVPQDSVTKTIGEVGFDETISTEYGRAGLVTDEKGQPLFGAWVVPVQMSDTGKVIQYVSVGRSLKEIPNPLYFTGIDEREWNCYVQKQIKTKLYLDGKPIC